MNHELFINHELKHMNGPSFIFWAIFVVPFIAFFAWLIWQDKRRRKSGLVVLAVTVIGCIVYLFWQLHRH
ncbi:MAG: hypothetical protein ABJA76_13220 [Mucilaginibacter sp.]